MNKAVIYCRVSSKDQEIEGYSIPAQIKLLKAYAQKKSLTIVEIFTEVETAKKAGRTQFNKMLAFFAKLAQREIHEKAMYRIDYHWTDP